MRVNQARHFALMAHGAQRYGDLPYAVHLDAVAALAAPYGPEAQVLAYLHDVVEDTAIGLDDVQAAFGPLVAQCVALLTDAPGATRQARKALTYARLAQVDGPAQLALVAKAADRLANVQACIATGNLRLWGVYLGEHPSFRAAAHRPGLCDALWEQLDALLARPAPTAAAPLQGACLCGGVRFVLQGPLPAVQVCHCSQCRKAQGGPFATNVPVATEALQWLSGQALMREFRATPGKRRVFCGQCGSPLFSARDDLPGVLRLRLGLVDEPTFTTPAFHAHVASKASWWPITDSLAQHAQGHTPEAEPGR